MKEVDIVWRCVGYEKMAFSMPRCTYDLIVKDSWLVHGVYMNPE